jgi:Tol biopolymer transport system component
VDKRSDIWAFGCVLYEMLTGTRAFVGENVTDTLAGIITKEPDWGALPAQTPPAIRRLLRRALAKDRNERLADIADARIELKDALTAPDTDGARAAETPRSRVRMAWTLAAAAAICVLAALATGLSVWVANRPSPSAPQRLSVVTLPDHPVAFSWIPGRSLAISPDGTAVVYVARNPNAAPGAPPYHLELRPLLDRGARVLPKTEGAVQPFFSPDGRWVAFFTQGTTHELKKVSLAGGNPVTLLERIEGGQWGVGTWTDDGAIIFSTVAGGLQRIPADGGPPRKATSLDAGEQSHRGAELVAGTRSVLFTVHFNEARSARIDAVMLDTGERRVIVDHGRGPHYLTSGHLLFQRGNEILIAPFDPKRLTITGPAVPFVEEVRLDGVASEGFTAQLAISRNGTLAYVPAVAANQTLGRVGRDGVFEPVGPAPSLFNLPRVSSTGQHIAFENWGGPQEIGVYVHDVVRGSTTKLSEEGENRWPAWHPDGKRVTFFSQLRNGMYLKDLSGGERLLLSGDAVSGELQPGSWSPDGKALAFTVQRSGSRDIWILSIGSDSRARPLLNSAAVEHTPKFSPDGQWLAYVSDESGRSEVYVRRYPDGDKLSVSTGSGTGPVWSRDGKEIFFQGAFEGAERLMVVSVTPDRGTVRLGTPRRLLDMRVPTPSGTIEAYGRSNVWGPAYDIFPDGKQFVMIKGADAQGTREIVLVQNWFEELKRSGR